MVQLFLEGGAVGMTILTLIFIALLLAAWKAPAWVKEIGLIGLVWGIIYTFVGFIQMAGCISSMPEGMSQVIIFGGFKVAVTSTVYGLIVYLVSLILRIVQKTRI